MKEDILKYLAEQAGRPLRIRDLSRRLQIPDEGYRAFRASLHELVHEGRIVHLRGNRYAAAERFDMVTGTVSATRHDYIFVEPEGGGDDIFVGPASTKGALHGDRVQVKVIARREKGLEGRVERILRHANESLVGFLVHDRSGWYMVPEDPNIRRHVLVDPASVGQARDDDLVVVHIEQWGTEFRDSWGRITEVLGDASDPAVETTALIRRAGLTEDFPPECRRDAEQVTREPLAAVIAGRTDLRERVVFTIDPADARDFDDAISIERRPGGGWTVGVHIADVSHYVREGSCLDTEAWARGTSVYLVGRVVPMLPEELSNEACSLRPDEESLTFSCFVSLDAEGRPTGTELADTVIRSQARLSYEQAQAVIERGGATGEVKDPRITEALIEMAGVARLLTRRRMERGTIDFDLPEPIIELDAAGNPVRLHQRPRLESHRLIEEFMILANEAVARWGHDCKLPFLYRIHEAPDPERIEEFREFLATLGFSLKKGAHTTPAALSRLLEQVEGTPVEALVNKVMLRHLRQAVYSVDNRGHFGLASQAYCHFTSPIRRYPDLVTHRLLRRYRDRAPAGPELDRLEGWLRRTAEQSTIRERAAMEAERESVKLKQIAYLEEHVGDVYPGYISGVTHFGLFVELEELLVDGLVRMSELEDDYYVYEEKNYRLVGERTGRVYRLGDRITVQVLRADRTSRQIDFLPAPLEEEPEPKPKPKSKPEPKPKSKPEPAPGRWSRTTRKRKRRR
jgi:ribonuclease R